jgi:hypothetical protein
MYELYCKQANVCPPEFVSVWGEITYFTWEERESWKEDMNENKFRVKREVNISGNEGLVFCRFILYRIDLRVMCGGEIWGPSVG